MKQNKYIVQAEQNLFDVLLQTTGSIEGIFQMIEENRFILSEVSANLTVGNELIIPPNIISNNVVLYEYLKKNTTIATGQEMQEGIGFWAIEVDFVIT